YGQVHQRGELPGSTIDENEGPALALPRQAVRPGRLGEVELELDQPPLPVADLLGLAAHDLGLVLDRVELALVAGEERLRDLLEVLRPVIRERLRQDAGEDRPDPLVPPAVVVLLGDRVVAAAPDGRAGLALRTDGQ